MSRRTAALLALAGVLWTTGCGAGSNGDHAPAGSAVAGSAPNVILFVGDGMGPGAVQAGGLYRNGAAGSLNFEAFPHRSQVATANAGGGVTDSAAAATAMATGRKVDNGVLSVALPGDGVPLPTVLEAHAAAGRATGLVTTTFISHATPAAFAAHRTSRNDYDGVIADYLAHSRPDLLLGGAAHVSAEQAAAAGYAVVTERAGLLALDTETAGRVWGLFGAGHLPYELDGVGALPHLSEMTRVALEVLDNDPDGFFLLVEGGRIDHAGHANDIDRQVRETAAFAAAVAEALAWAGDRTDTLILVTADHETGGLAVTGAGAAGAAPPVTWSTTGHTGAPVAAYAWGAGAAALEDIADNTQLHPLLLGRVP